MSHGNITAPLGFNIVLPSQRLLSKSLGGWVNLVLWRFNFQPALYTTGFVSEKIQHLGTS